MKHLVLAYATNDSLSGFAEKDMKKLTHINLAFGLIKDGVLDMSGLAHLDLLPRFRQWNPEIKIVLSVGGWGAGGFSLMARTAAGRERFAGSCLEAVERYALDGIDIDWEYPCSDQAEIDCSPADRENFTLLLRELRRQLGDRILSIAAGAGEYYIEGTEMEQVAETVDYVQLMTYDMCGGFSHRTGHHAALYPSAGDGRKINTRDIVQLFAGAGVPREKIVIGAAFYSRRWTGVRSAENHGLLQEAESVGQGGPAYSQLTHEFVKQNGFTQYWDEDAQAAYLWNGTEFISFESPRAIELKTAFVKEQGLLGIMYWEHGCDTTGELLEAIHRAMAE